MKGAGNSSLHRQAVEFSDDGVDTVEAVGRLRGQWVQAAAARTAVGDGPGRAFQPGDEGGPLVVGGVGTQATSHRSTVAVCPPGDPAVAIVWESGVG